MSGRLLVAGTLLLALVGCHDSTPTEPGDGVYGHVWTLEAFVGADGVETPAAPGQTLTLDLEPESTGASQGEAKVVADCIVCNGQHRLGPSALASFDLTCTEPACPVGSQGPEFVDALRRTESFTALDGRLWLYDATGRNYLRLR